jgi:hypothetical protein
MFDWETANKYCSKFELKSSGIILNNFYLPEKENLESLYKSRFKLKNKISSYYWSSSKYIKDNTKSWTVSFEKDDGEAYYSNNFDKGYVRCVVDSKYFDDMSIIDISKKLIYDKNKKTTKQFIKGEFETTQDFNKRISAIHNNGNKKQKKIKNKNWINAIAKAYQLKYGMPKIKSLKYNADKQSFVVLLSSKRGEFNKIINIPVKLNHAKYVKEM